MNIKFDVDSLFIVFREFEEVEELKRLYVEDYKALIDLIAESYRLRREYEDRLTPQEFNAYKKYYDLLFDLANVEKQKSKFTIIAQDQEDIDYQYQRFKLDNQLEGKEALSQFKASTGYVLLPNNKWYSIQGYTNAYEEITKQLKDLETEETINFSEDFKNLRRELGKLGRELKTRRDITSKISSDIKPIGYTKQLVSTTHNGVTNTSSKWVLDKEFGINLKNELSELEKLRDSIKDLDEYKFLLDNINSDIKLHRNIYKKYLRNVITESLLEVVSNPERYERTLFSISMGKLEQAGRNAGNVIAKNRDLSNPLEKYEAFASLTDGKVLTGAFANAVKVFSYASRGGAYEELNEIYYELNMIRKALKGDPQALMIQSWMNPKLTEAIENQVSVNPETDSSSLVAKDSRESVLVSRYNQLLRLRRNYIKSLENNNDLPFFNPSVSFQIDDVIYSGLAKMDSAKENFVTVIFDGLINAAIDNLKEQLLPYIKVNSLTGSAMVGLVAAGVPINTVVKILSHPVLAPLNTGKVHRVQNFFRDMDEKYDVNDSQLLSIDLNDTSDITSEKIYNIFKKATKIGEDIRALSDFMNIIRSVPVFSEDIDNVLHNFKNKVGNVEEINGELVLIPRADFSLVIPNLFKNAPHVGAAYRALLALQEVITNSFTIHNNTIRNFAKDLNMSSALEKDDVSDTVVMEEVSIRNTLANYLMGIYISEQLPEENILNGKLNSPEKIFSDKVWNNMNLLKDYIKIHNQSNKFLSYLSVYTDYQNGGAKKITFSGGVNLNIIDIHQILLGFKMLSKYDIIDGKVVEVQRSINATSQIQKDLVKFAQLNFGLDFSNFSFAKFISTPLIKKEDETLEKLLIKYGENRVELNKVEEHFKLSYILQNVNRLPIILYSFKGNKVYTFIVNEMTDAKIYFGRETVNDREVVYDLKLNVVPGLKYPDYFKRNFKRRATVYKKIYATDTAVYYTKVARVSDVFFSKFKGESYALSDYFDNTIPLPYWQRGDNFVIGSNSPIKIGDVVHMYPSYNADRSKGVKAKITNIEYYREDKYTGKKYYYELVTPLLEDKNDSEEVVLLTNNPPVSYGLFEELNPDGVKRVVNPDGTTHYEVKDVKIGTVTQDLIPTMQTRTWDKSTSIGQRKAEKVFRNEPDGAVKQVAESNTKVTRDEYAKIIDDIVDKAIAKGNIIDALISSTFNNDPEIIQSLNDNLTKYGFLIEEFDWVKNNIGGILSKGNTDYYLRAVKDGQVYYIDNPNRKDTIFAQMPVGIITSKYKFYGTMDIVVDHGNDLYSIYDIKSGSTFDKNFESDILKYGNTATELIFDNPRNRAKLQLMWYAIMFKHSKPNSKFKTIKPIHVRNKYSIDANDHHNNIRVEGYLSMIKNFLEKEMPELYQELSKTEGIFNAETYQVKPADTLIDDAKLSTGENLKLLNLHLQDLINRQTHLEEKIRQGKLGYKNKNEEISLLDDIKATMEKIIKIRRDGSYTSFDGDISWMDSWIGSASASTNMYVQLYYSMLSQQKTELNKVKTEWNKRHKVLLENLAKSLGISRGLNSYIGGTDNVKLFDWMYVKNENGVQRYLTDTLEEDKQRFNQLSKAQKDYLIFTLDSIEQFFVDSQSTYVDPRTNKKTALANKVVTEKEVKGRMTKLTNLDLVNGIGSRPRSVPFTYQRGFIPKVAPTKDDIISKYGRLSKEYLEYLYNSNLTTYFESTFDGWEQQDEVIPMQYLGNDEINNTQNFTTNSEVALTKFMNAYLNKQYLDEVYTYAYGTKLYLIAKEDKQNNINFENLISYFEDTIDLHILGRRQQDLKLSNRDFMLNSSKGFKRFNFVKFIRSIKSFFSASTMWLKPITGTANFIFASLINLKEAIKGSMAKNIFGQNADFTISDLARGYYYAMGILRDEMLDVINPSGNHKERNKLYQLMKKYNMYNDSYDWYTEPNSLFTAKNKLFTGKTLYMFHSIPEEIVSASIFYAQLKAMKTEDGKSVWDHYTDPVKTDINGIEVYDVKWDGTVRGKVKRNTYSVAEYDDLTELSTEEINNIKYLYEKMHGGYKVEERTRLEYYVFGELLLQFKKYMPSMMKNVGASRGYRRTEGKWELDTENNQQIKRWSPQMIEGRWRLLTGIVLNQLGLKFTKDTNIVGRFLGNQIDASYDWDKLSEKQKQDLLDGAVVLTMFLLMTVGTYAGWDRDEEDSTKKLISKITKDLAAQWWLPTLVTDIVKFGAAPVTGQKTIKLLASASELMTSILIYPFDEEQALTNQGNLRGWKDTERLIPLFASWHNLTKFYEEDNTLFVNQRQK